VTKFFCNKDLAREMGVESPRTVRRWIKRLGIAPTIPGCSSHRWSLADAQKFLNRYKAKLAQNAKINAQRQKANARNAAKRGLAPA
jgi:transposase-like protein